MLKVLSATCSRCVLLSDTFSGRWPSTSIITLDVYGPMCLKTMRNEAVSDKELPLGAREGINDIVDKINSSGKELSQDTMRQSRRVLRSNRRQLKAFEKKILKRWGSALGKLDLLIQVSHEIGMEFNSKHRPAAHSEEDYSFEVLTHLHGRTCRISREISTLLHGGYASGALARWRTLHEIAVVAGTIRRHGKELAHKYLLHVDIEHYRAIIEYQAHRSELGYDSYTESEVVRAEERMKELLAEYGREYRGRYGWASEVLNTSDPSFAQIEEAARLSYLRPYYRLASHDVHAGPIGIRENIGVPEGSWLSLILAGPSNMGLADPGQLTAISLYQTTAALATSRHDVEILVALSAMDDLMEGTKQEFARIHRQLQKLIESAPSPILYSQPKSLFKWKRGT